MLLLPLLALFAFPLCLAATKDTREDLVRLAKAGNGIIKLDERTYDSLTASDREWSATIVFTALDTRRKCGPCKQFQPSFEAVAQAWNKVPATSRNEHFFAIADFDEAPKIFTKLGIQSAPVVHNYPVAEGPRKPAHGKPYPSTYDFSNGYAPEALAEHLSLYTPVRIPYRPPVDWAKYGTFAATGLILTTVARFIFPLLKSRITWAIITIGTILVMTGGHMFVRIRGMPYSDGPNWIAGGYQSQYGQETQVIALTYGILGGAFLMLTLVAPYQTSKSRQQLQVWLWSIVIFVMFSVLISLFRVKNRGYPFKLLL
ncbi:oligosaccharyl transferase subunit OST3/OST6 family [Irpex rosettiformis]|uniref:Oligosaccharyl transferase subunit OST3/OST6 family n=1 Tax=Irpex rosettiformis TaxID=378272 RepID=A0ACB8UIQ4_9APHY|nr:oligosaccharyl transferase subunit OST3/OST6 family [Irpex rosettiformis]